MLRSVKYAIVLLAVPCTSLAQELEGYASGPAVLLPDSLREVSLGGRLELTITRQVADSAHRALIEAAERLYPTDATIQGALQEMWASDPGPYMRDRFEAAALIEGGPRWWWHDTQYFRVPFALTGSAVAYNLARAREVVDIPVQPRPGAISRRVYVEYTAVIEERGFDAEGPIAVRLLLRVGQHCGGLCGGGFEARRWIVFDPEGRPIRMAGDGDVRYWAS